MKVNLPSSGRFRATNSFMEPVTMLGSELEVFAKLDKLKAIGKLCQQYIKKQKEV